MKLIVISSPVNIPYEEESLTSLFDEGLSSFHLRKPEMSDKDLIDFLTKIPPKYYRRIVIHSHFHLLKKYNLKGIHLPGFYYKQLRDAELKTLLHTGKSKGLSISTSAHSIDEAGTLPSFFDYLFLSPIFDSISKEGYLSKFDSGDLEIFLRERKTKKPEMIALGGISHETIKQAANIGFQGIACLGYIWEVPNNDSDGRVERYKKLKELCQTAGHIS